MQRIGRYDVVRELGRGGMGTVYLARDPELQRALALKLLLHQGDAKLRARFRSEARALAALSHPGIVTIFEIGEHEGQQFIAMEYLKGLSLRELVQRHPPPDRDRVVVICGELAIAVAAAHAAGILHRDIKPENVIVGETGAVKVVDFGIAHRLDADDMPTVDESLPRANALVDVFTHTQRALSVDTAVVVDGATAQTVFGTPAYMAPEVLEGAPSTTASDVYSLGVTIYECLAGHRPYDAPSLIEMIAMVIAGSDRPPPLDDPLNELVVRMLARDPEARPALAEIAAALVPDGRGSARSVIQRSQPAPTDAVTLAHTPPEATGVARTAATLVRPRKRRSRAGMFAAAAVIAAAAAGGVTWWVLRDDATPAGAPIATSTIAVERFEASFSTYGAGVASPVAFGDIAARLLAAEGVRTISPLQLEHEAAQGPWVDAARKLGATHLVRGKLGERGPDVVAAVELVELASGRVETIAATGTIGELARVMSDVAHAVVFRLGGVPAIRPYDRALATSLFDVGNAQLGANNWFFARPYLEQAVQADPAFAEGWRAVASVRGWTIAPAPLTDAAIARTIALTDDPATRRILLGAQQYHRFAFADAVATLTPLLDARLSDGDRRDLHYYLGEASFHDGDHDTGVLFLRKLLDRAVPFKHAAIHVTEHALARRDTEAAMRYDVQRVSSRVDIAAGRYEQVASSDVTPFSLHARLILGRTLAPEDVPKLGNALAQKVYRLAIARGAGADAAFADAWHDVDGAAPNAIASELLELLEVVLVGEHAAAAKQLIEYLAPRVDAFRGIRRYAILAGALLRSPVPFARAGLTTREARLATAIEAELAGDHATAAAILAELVANPSSHWDYPERAALARNLRVLGRSRDLAALCTDTMKPAVFRLAWLPMRRVCR